MNKVNVIKQNLEFIGKTWIKYIGTFASILSLFFLFWTWDDIRITSTQYKCVIIILLCVLALILAFYCAGVRIITNLLKYGPKMEF